MASAPLYSSPQAFVNAMASYAVAAQAATGINANLILAQWGNETGWGTSPAWANNFNPAGIGITSSSVTGKNYGSVQAGVQAYIDFINNNSRYQAVKDAGVNDPEAQALAMGNSGWAAGGYEAAGSSVKGSALVQDMQSFTAPTGVTPATGLSTAGSGLASLTPAQGQALQSAVAEGGGAYLTALNAANQSANTAGLPAPGDTSAQGSAISLIDTTLQQYGLGDLSNWAWTELTNGKNSDQIMLDLQNQPAYVNSIFGQTNKARVANGLAPMTPTQILSYKDTAQTAAQAAGLPQGFLDTGTLVNLMGNDVSATELTQRITSGYAAAMDAPQETRDLLHQYFGVDTGNLAAYYLDPTKAEDLLKNQLVAAEVGTQAAQSGFGQLNATQAQQLTGELAAKGQINPSGSGTWDVNVGSTFAQLAPLAQLEQQMPGMGASAPAVSQNDLLGYGFLSRGQATVQSALETRRAFASGGGGEDVGSQGVIGAGNAPSEGNKQAGQSYG